jgi:hypothetical protein
MDGDQGDQRRASLRASDADREQVVEALRQHHAEGRLTVEELTDRSGQAYTARTLGDLDALASDLPPIQPPGPAGPPASTGLPPRMRPPGPDRAAAKAGMLRSILWYGILSVFLIVVWAISGSDVFWPVWPILGFLLLVAWQAINLYSRVGWYDDEPPRPWHR